MLSHLRRALLLVLVITVGVAVFAASQTVANESVATNLGRPEQVILVADAPSAPTPAPPANQPLPDQPTAQPVPPEADSAPPTNQPLPDQPTAQPVPPEADSAPLSADLPLLYLSPVTAAASPFTHALLRWELHAPTPEALILELRVSPDGAQWSAWGLMTANDDLWVPEDGDLVVWGEVAYVGDDMRFWQVRAQPVPGQEASWPLLRQVEVNTVDARFGPTEPAFEDNGSLDQLDPAQLGRPPVVSRTAWGNPDGQGSRVTPAYRPVTHLVLHHTADANSLSGTQSSWADRVRAIWSFHTFTRGWGDIGYNYLIDPNGVIYEGRAGGDDAVGFHDTANYGSMGVAVIGTYSALQPTGPAQTSLVNLLAWKAAQKGINPYGRAAYHGCAYSSACNPFNPGAVLDQLTGHREVTPGRTSCPGDSFAGLLPSLRQRVVERIAAAEPQPPPPSLELLEVRYERQALTVGELLRISFIVRNAGTTALESQAPEAGRRTEDGAYDLSDSYVYDERECFLGTPASAEPAFPKAEGRFRVLLGPVEAERQPACVGDAGGYPWRWGLNGRLEPGETREIVGFVRMRQPGTFTLQAGAIHEYVRYTADKLAPTTITVAPERQGPGVVAYDTDLHPQAHVYQLGAAPLNLLARPAAAADAPRGAYVGSFVWDGTPVAWGVGGPLPDQPVIVDSFVIEQVRTFTAPVTGEYRFLVLGDDSAALWINGTLLAWKGAADPYAVSEATVWLEAGQHRLAFRHVELGGEARAGYLVREPEAASFSPVREGLIQQPDTWLGPRLRGLGGLTLVADDFGGAGVAALLVSVNDAAWYESPGAQAVLDPLPNGTHTVRYQARDGLGNLSEQRALVFVVDRATPVFRMYLPIVGR